MERDQGECDDVWAMTTAAGAGFANEWHSFRAVLKALELSGGQTQQERVGAAVECDRGGAELKLCVGRRRWKTRIYRHMRSCRTIFANTFIVRAATVLVVS